MGFTTESYFTSFAPVTPLHRCWGKGVPQGPRAVSQALLLTAISEQQAWATAALRRWGGLGVAAGDFRAPVRGQP